MVPLSSGAAAPLPPPPTEDLLELFPAQICSVLNHVSYFRIV